MHAADDLARNVVGQRVRHSGQENSCVIDLLPMRLNSGAKFSGFWMPSISWQEAQPYSVTSSLPCAICSGVAGSRCTLPEQIGIGLACRKPAA